ncbi:MAG TPA: ATP-binding protein, partial [Candidatus Eisenbacteria bacterium]|nr:ATP-binding protein [Candidatus Eisenbacteria bacterium]
HDDDTLLVVSRELDAAEQASAIVWLERARAEGRHLALVASRDSAHDIDAWLAILPGLVELGQQGAEQVRLAVHEVSTNVAEHACGMDPNQRFDLWWVPDGEGCHFLLRDRGRSFRYHEWQPSRFSDPAVRRRGRGFGLDIVHRVMSRVEYYPGTREGNLTCLTFDPRKLSMREEVHESHR